MSFKNCAEHYWVCLHVAISIDWFAWLNRIIIDMISNDNRYTDRSGAFYLLIGQPLAKKPADE